MELEKRTWHGQGEKAGLCLQTTKSYSRTNVETHQAVRRGWPRQRELGAEAFESSEQVMRIWTPAVAGVVARRLWTERDSGGLMEGVVTNLRTLYTPALSNFAVVHSHDVFSPP